MPRGIYVRTPEYRQKQRVAQSKRAPLPPLSLEARKKISARQIGRRHSVETKMKMSASHQGLKPYEMTDAIRRNMSLAHKGKMTRERNPNWRGGNGIGSGQARIRRERLVINGGFHANVQWERLKDQFNRTCPSCKKVEPEIVLTKDHIVPILKGGTDDIENIQPLCKSCNSRKKITIIRYSLPHEKVEINLKHQY